MFRVEWWEEIERGMGMTYTNDFETEDEAISECGKLFELGYTDYINYKEVK